MRTLLDPKLDVVFKLMVTAGPESDRVLCGLLSAVLERPIASATVLNPEIASELVADRAVMLNVVCELPDGKRSLIEVQRDRRAGFAYRSMYDWQKLYCSPVDEEGGDFDDLVPVIGVAILGFVETDCPRLHGVYRLVERSDGEVFSDDLELHMIELPKLKEMNPEEAEQQQALVRWCRFLTAETDEEMEEVAKMDPDIEAAQRELKRLSADPKVQELVRQREEALELYQFELAAERKQGREEGRQEGFARGQQEGRLIEARLALRRVLTRRGLKVSSALSKKIDRCTDLATLARWLEAAVVAQSAEEALESQGPSRP